MLARWSWVLFVLAACGSDDSSSSNSCPSDPNKAPVIDSLDSSAEVAASNGRYVAPVSVKFHDENCDAVTKVRVRIPTGNYDDTTTIRDAVPDAKGATVTLDFDAATVAAGTYEYFVSVFDAKGLESEAKSKTITFK